MLILRKQTVQRGVREERGGKCDELRVLRERPVYLPWVYPALSMVGQKMGVGLSTISRFPRESFLDRLVPDFQLSPLNLDGIFGHRTDLSCRYE